MGKVYSWIETTTGHVMLVNGKNRWLVRDCGGKFELYEVVKGNDGCLLRDVSFSLDGAKHRAYLIECQEKNSRRRMELAIAK